MTRLSDELLRFVTALRAAGVRISVAETLDAMNAVAAAGIERVRMSEALAATLIKDEADRPLFDSILAEFFGARPAPADNQGHKPGSQSSAAPGSRHFGESLQGGRSQDEPRPGPSGKSTIADQSPATAQTGDDSKESEEEDSPTPDSSSQSSPSQAARAGENSDDATEREHGREPGASGESGRLARDRHIERTPFSRYSDFEYEQARDALAPIARRFRARLGRRLKSAHLGRLDFRRTIRASIQRGGALADLRFRTRRPQHIDLVILADISGSVRYSSTLMLELIAGAHDFFPRLKGYVYIDRLAEAGFEDGHLVMTPAIDLYARSDFGRVLAELWERRGEILTRGSVLVIMGDGRNNRRPARAGLLGDLSRMCRATIWLNPEARERWGTGDSAVLQYAREVGGLIASGNLRELERGLAETIA